MQSDRYRRAADGRVYPLIPVISSATRLCPTRCVRSSPQVNPWHGDRDRVWFHLFTTKMPLVVMFPLFPAHLVPVFREVFRRNHFNQFTFGSTIPVWQLKSSISVWPSSPYDKLFFGPLSTTAVYRLLGVFFSVQVPLTLTPSPIPQQFKEVQRRD